MWTSLIVGGALPLLASAASLPKQEFRTCVTDALGQDAAKRIVVPSDSYYLDARLGEKIQLVTEHT